MSELNVVPSKEVVDRRAVRPLTLILGSAFLTSIFWTLDVASLSNANSMPYVPLKNGVVALFLVSLLTFALASRSSRTNGLSRTNSTLGVAIVSFSGGVVGSTLSARGESSNEIVLTSVLTASLIAFIVTSAFLFINWCPNLQRWWRDKRR